MKIFDMTYLNLACMSFILIQLHEKPYIDRCIESRYGSYLRYLPRSVTTYLKKLHLKDGLFNMTIIGFGVSNDYKYCT